MRTAIALGLFFPAVWGAQWGAVEWLTRSAVQNLRALDALLTGLHPQQRGSGPLLAPPEPSRKSGGTLKDETVDPQGRVERVSPGISPRTAVQRTQRTDTSQADPTGLVFSRELILELARRRAIPGWATKAAGGGRRAGIELVAGIPGSGVLPGDRIVALDGRATPDFSSLTQRVLSALIAGESALSVSLERARAEKVLILPVMVELPPLPEDVREGL